MKKNIFAVALLALFMAAGDLYAQMAVGTAALYEPPKFFDAQNNGVIGMNSVSATDNILKASFDKAQNYIPVYNRSNFDKSFASLIKNSRSILLAQIRYAKIFLAQA